MIASKHPDQSDFILLRPATGNDQAMSSSKFTKVAPDPFSRGTVRANCPPRKRFLRRRVSFSQFTTVNLLPPKLPPPEDSPEPATQEQNQRSSNDFDAISSEPPVLDDGKVPYERRVHQKTAIVAILSYQRRMKDNLKAARSSKSEQLLAHVSSKFSQRSKDIAQESARQTFLEAYPHSEGFVPRYCAAGKFDIDPSVPVHISAFPIIKKKRESGNGQADPSDRPPKRRRSPAA